MTDKYEGFHEFFHARSQALMRDAFMLTGNTTSAEELLQSAMVKLVANWKRVERGGHPEAYLKKVMLNEVRGGWRRRLTQLRAELALQPVSELPSNVPLDEVLDRSAIRQALASLTDRQRTVVFLRYYEDLSESETARQMGCSVGTVKSQSHAALKRLRLDEVAAVADTHRRQR